MEIITVTDVVKNYENNGLTVQAVRGVTLRIGQGEFSAIAGPSGSGKTTLLNLIGGLDRPSGGTITVSGNVLSRMSPKELADMRLRKIGFVFQAYNLIPVLSARENVEYVLLLQGVGRAEREKRSVSILNEVGLESQINRLPKEMSGGQQQRVAVARAIVSEPSIVLADEPTANLDQKTGEALIDLMHQLNREKKITFLFSTHDKMVMERAERLIRLTDGKVSLDIAEKPRGGKVKRAAPSSRKRR